MKLMPAGGNGCGEIQKAQHPIRWQSIEVSNETNQGREVPQQMLTSFLRTAPNTDHWGRDPLHSPEAESVVPRQSCTGFVQLCTVHLTDADAADIS